MLLTKQRIRRILPIVLGAAVVFFVVAKPSAAHAGLLDVASVAYEAVLDIILSVLVTVNSLLALLLDASGGALEWVLSLEISTQLRVIDIAWTAIRDMCNLVFIVVFIGIAFGTIFNATGLFKSWHYSTALMPLLVAAILMNFSLAIGKTIALVSNQAVKSVLLVSGDPGRRLVDILKPNNLAIGGINLNARAALSVPIVDATKTLNDVEEKRFQECLKEKRPGGTFVQRWIFNQPEGTEYKGLGDCNAEILAARSGTTVTAIAQAGQQAAAGGAAIVSGTIEQKVMYIADGFFKVLMILLFTSCLLSAFVFLALRILMVWALLATAALAWASYAIPGQRAFWKTWWNHMIAWNVFGPLYLLSLIPGLVMLGGSGEMMAQLTRAGGSISPASMFVQQFFFYVFAVMIFVGGLALTLKGSFAITVAGSGVLGKMATGLGVFQTGEAKLGQISKYTGATGAYDTLKATAVARGEKLGQVGTNIKNRLPFQPESYDRKLARMKAGMGVYGGEKGFTDVQAKEIDVEKKRLDGRLAMIPKAEQEKFLRSQSTSSNKNLALAAREILLSKGALTDAEKLKTREMYPNSGAKRAFDDRVKRSAGAAVREKKKESEEKRNDIIATVGAMGKVDAPAVQKMLEPYFEPKAGAPPPDKKEQAAYMEALGLKDPALLYDYLRAHPDPKNPATPETDRARAFAPVLKKPENAIDLHEDFLKDAAKLKLLQEAIDHTYPKGTGKAGQKRLRAKEKLRTDRPEMENEINLVFTP